MKLNDRITSTRIEWLVNVRLQTSTCSTIFETIRQTVLRLSSSCPQSCIPHSTFGQTISSLYLYITCIIIPCSVYSSNHSGRCDRNQIESMKTMYQKFMHWLWSIESLFLFSFLSFRMWFVAAVYFVRRSSVVCIFCFFALFLRFAPKQARLSVHLDITNITYDT